MNEKTVEKQDGKTLENKQDTKSAAAVRTRRIPRNDIQQEPYIYERYAINSVLANPSFLYHMLQLRDGIRSLSELNFYAIELADTFFHMPDLEEELVRRVSEYTLQESQNKNTYNSSVKILVDKRGATEDDKSSTCTICLDNFQTDDSIAVVQTCKHIFHHACLSEWGKYNARCPVCRTQIPILG